MTKRNGLNAGARVAAFSRRDILVAGSTIVPVAILLPAWMTASAQTKSTFDFYISPSGSDSSSGSLSAPWSITSLRVGSTNFSKMPGKRIGLLPGTYSVGNYVFADSSTGALQIPGGTSSASTYVASCDSSGNYSPRTAKITALLNGVYGGQAGYGHNGPIISHVGTYPNTYPVGYLTLDGLVISGFSYKGIRIGGNSSGDGPSGLRGIVVQNCEFTGGAHNSGDATDNTNALWLDYTVGALVTNNYFHDNYGFNKTDMGHLNGVICWGCQGTTVQFNTLINAGNIYGKEVANQGNTVQYNYVDASMYTTTGSSSGIEDWTGANTGGLTQTTNINNNIIKSSAWGIQGATLSYSYGWTTPVNIYNNTIILSKGAGPYPAAWVTSQSSRNVRFYNNIYAGVADGSGYKSFHLNAKGPAVWDYNLYIATGMSWELSEDSALGSAAGSYTSQSAVQSAVAGLGGISSIDTHSISSDSPGFAGSGALALAYKLASTSPARNRGSTNGTTSGAACDMGAWGNGATQVGCNFTSGASTTPDSSPKAPSLTIS
jgi:hypothetical protein